MNHKYVIVSYELLFTLNGREADRIEGSCKRTSQNSVVWEMFRSYIWSLKVTRRLPYEKEVQIFQKYSKHFKILEARSSNVNVHKYYALRSKTESPGTSCRSGFVHSNFFMTSVIIKYTHMCETGLGKKYFNGHNFICGHAYWYWRFTYIRNKILINSRVVWMSASEFYVNSYWNGFSLWTVQKNRLFSRAAVRTCHNLTCDSQLVAEPLQYLASIIFYGWSMNYFDMLLSVTVKKLARIVYLYVLYGWTYHSNNPRSYSLIWRIME